MGKMGTGICSFSVLEIGIFTGNGIFLNRFLNWDWDFTIFC